MNDRTDVLVGRYVPNYCRSRVLILGCGNVLFGDDGFGPAVIDHLTENYALPDDVCALDVGTGVRDLLCTVALSPIRPRRAVVVDAVDIGCDPGQMVVAPIEKVVAARASSFSLHELPTTSLLRDLKECCQVNILLVAVQPESIPEIVKPGLSQRLRCAVAPVCDCIMRNCLYEKD